MDDTKGDAIGPTLAADPARGATGDHGPLAAGSKPGGDDTMPAGEASTAGVSSGAASDSGARAGRPSDYATLLPVNPAHYVRERELARGGMGRIVVARDRRLGREVAIKEVHVNDAALRIRFEREARITARLQHPSTIGLLEAGMWPTGEPFYAMPLVAGRPLDKVIADAKTVDARFGLIANVVAVADTLAHAHSRRIVHRDLKPANVLVGEFGETVVIDWGLAKDLNVLGEESMRPSAPSLGATSSQSGETEHGTVIGTPAYMPPEQADGNPVDERADVYALGALLYTVLAGRAPYLGRSAEGVLADVLFGPPPRLATLVPEAPPDLITIVEKAMARDPADRFPTAKELAVELKNFQTGQLVGSHRYTLGELLKRWLRKYRLTIAVASAGVVALAVVGAISVRRVVHARAVADQQRVVAEQQRAIAIERDSDARDLISFMLGDLHKKLEMTGKLDLLEAAANKVLAYYDRPGVTNTERDQLQRAEAIERVGDVALARGDLAAANTLFNKSRVLNEEIVARNPTSNDAIYGRARVETRLGDVATALLDTKGAEANFRAAIRHIEEVLARTPQDGMALEMLQAQRGLGDTLLDSGDGAGAGSAYRAGIAIAMAYLAKTPDSVDWKRGLAVVRSQLGALLLMQGDAEGALREQREDIRLSEEIAVASPKETRAQNDVAGAHLRLGDIFRATGDSASALAEFQSSLATMKHLTSIDPTNLDWANDRCACHDRVGNILLARGDTHGARAAFEECLALRQQAVARDARSYQRRNLGVSHNKLGNVFETEKKFAAALAEYELGLPIFEQISSEDPQNAALQRDLAVNLYLGADMLLATGRRAAALERHRRALAIGVALHKLDPSNTIWEGDEIESHLAVAKVLAALGEKPDALAEYKAALALAEAAAAREADNPQWADYVKQAQAAIKACCAKLR
jgi:tetratricopeptide (TPR) repeat protein